LEEDSCCTLGEELEPYDQFLLEICTLLGYYAACDDTTLHNIPEEHRSDQHRGGSMKSGLVSACFEQF
jgi:hypothetical protein